MSDQWATFERIETVIAVQLKQPLVWRTEYGALMKSEAGDWLITDTTGGPRTVTDTNFRASYFRVHSNRWRRVSRVQARRAYPGETVNTPEGVVVAEEGAAWLARDGSGAEWVVPEHYFRRAYRRCRDSDTREWEPPASPPEGLE